MLFNFETVKDTANGYSHNNGFKNGTLTNNESAYLDIMRGMRRTRKPAEKVVLPAAVQEIQTAVCLMHDVTLQRVIYSFSVVILGQQSIRR